MSVAAWWSYADADTTTLGIVVAAVAVAAIAFVATRLVGRRRR